MTEPLADQPPELAAADEMTPERRTIEGQRQTIVVLQSVIASQAVEIHSLRSALAASEG